MNSGYIVMCNNRTELEDLIYSVLNSKRVINVMQELIRINQIEKEEANAFGTNMDAKLEEVDNNE